MTNDTSSSDSIQIPLTRGHTAIISSVDVDLTQLKWCSVIHPDSLTVYAQRAIKINGKRGTQVIHRVIMERILGRPLAKNELVDHEDRNGLNNRRENLRLATRSQNVWNRNTNSKNTSGYKGVFWYKRSQVWKAMITVHKHQKFLGYFHDPKDAARAYNKAALEHFGEFAVLNVIPE